MVIEVKTPDWSDWPDFVQEDVNKCIFIAVLDIAYKLKLNVNIKRKGNSRMIYNKPIVNPNSYNTVYLEGYDTIDIKSIEKLEILNN